MAAQYILAILAVPFVIMGLWRASSHGVSHPQARAWLIIGSLFTVVSAWLFLGG